MCGCFNDVCGIDFNFLIESLIRITVSRKIYHDILLEEMQSK